MQFIITAYDFTDEDAINRRLANREAHLAGLERMTKEGTFLSGGAILNKEGKMIGSSAHVEFPCISDVKSWIATDPYTIGEVWDNVQICEGVLFPVSNFTE